MMNYIKIILLFILVFVSIDLSVVGQDTVIEQKAVVGTVIVENSDDDFGDFEDEFNQDDQEVIYDPLIRYNRFMFEVNDKIFVYFLKPVAKTYNKILPQKIRISIRMFFKNITFPIRFANNILQGKFKNSAVEFERFMINSTIGVLGFMDPASSKFNVISKDEDFGQTLGHYGVNEGIPFVIPFLGMSNLRDLVGLVPDYFINPLSYVTPSKVKTTVTVEKTINSVSLMIGDYDSLMKDSLDAYTFLRDLYRKDRQNKVKE